MPYQAFRIEPDRISFVHYDGEALHELDSVVAETKANTWYTVKLSVVLSGPTLGKVSVERVSDTPGEPVATLLTSMPVEELGEIDADSIGFTVGAQARYDFQLVEHALDGAGDIADTFIDFTRDALGRKISRSVYDADGLLSQTLYVWDGWQLLAEVDGQTGDLIADYVHGPGYIDDLVVSRRDRDRDGDFDTDEQFFYLTDQQYSTVALLDAAGDVVERYGYDAFGAPTFYDGDGTVLGEGVSAVGNEHLYTGRQWLADFGSYDYRQRIYVPYFGRFLNTDPVYDPTNLGNRSFGLPSILVE